jgi:hypothetical protein
MVKFITLLASLIFASLAYCAPASQESDAKVEQLLETMLANVDQVMRRSMETSMQGQQLSPEQRQAVDGAAAKFVQVMREEMTWDKLRPLYVGGKASPRVRRRFHVQRVGPNRGKRIR